MSRGSRIHVYTGDTRQPRTGCRTGARCNAVAYTKKIYSKKNGSKTNTSRAKKKCFRKKNSSKSFTRLKKIRFPICTTKTFITILFTGATTKPLHAIKSGRQRALAPCDQLNPHNSRSKSGRQKINSLPIPSHPIPSNVPALLTCIEILPSVCLSLRFPAARAGRWDLIPAALFLPAALK